MEDGSSMPLWGLFVLLLLLWLNGIFYGFAAALRNISENDTQKKAEEGDKKAQMLMALIDKPAQFVNAIPLIVMACGICFGTFLVPYAVDVFNPYIKHVPALILVMALCVIFLAAIGILTFRRVGTFLGKTAETFYCVCYLDRQTGGSAFWRGDKPYRKGSHRRRDYFHRG